MGLKRAKNENTIFDLSFGLPIGKVPDLTEKVRLVLSRAPRDGRKCTLGVALHSRVKGRNVDANFDLQMQHLMFRFF